MIYSPMSFYVKYAGMVSNMGYYWSAEYTGMKKKKKEEKDD